MIEAKEKKIKKEILMMERKDRREEWLARMERERLDLVRSRLLRVLLSRKIIWLI